MTLNLPRNSLKLTRIFKMNISKYFLTCSLLVLGYSAVAQDDFLQVTQTPLLLNPSNSGGKAERRVAAALNRLSSNSSIDNSEKKSLYKNAYVSYDWLMKKHGLGAGIYYAFNQMKYFNNESILNQQNWTEEEKEKLKYTGLLATNKNRIGLSIAPKYNIKSRKEYNKIIYTFSPSLFLEYSNSKYSNDHHYESVKSLIYDSNFPDGKVVSNTLKYYQTNIKSNILKTGLGLQWNTNSFVLMYKAIYEIKRSSEQMDLTTLNNSNINEVQRSFNFNKTLYALEQTLVIGKTFPANLNSKFSVTPLMGYGYRNNLNSQGHKSNPDSTLYVSHIFRERINYHSFIHASIMLRYSIFLLGAGATNAAFGNEYAGFTLGLQGKKYKVTSSISKFKDMRGDKTLFNEVTVNYFF